MRINMANTALIVITISSCLVQTGLTQPKEDVLKPYDGPSVRGVDPSTLTGKVMAGYQGWFNCPEDGAGLGWTHWGGRRGFKPGSLTVDLWPDVSEYDADELYPTAFTHTDGVSAIG